MTDDPTPPPDATKSVTFSFRSSAEDFERILEAFKAGKLAHLGVTGIEVHGPAGLAARAGDAISPVRIEEAGDAASATPAGWADRAKRGRSDHRDVEP